MYSSRDNWRKTGQSLRFVRGDPINTNCSCIFLFNEPSGITTPNSIVPDNGITTSATATVVTPTPFGRGLYFNGTSSVITTAPNTAIINGPSAGLSISAWVIPFANSSGGIAGRSVSGADWCVSLSSNEFSIVLTSPSTAQFTATAPVPPNNRLLHVVAVWKVGSYLAIYQNGVLRQKTTCTSNNLRNTTAAVTIGDSAASFFNGVIDNIRFWGGSPTNVGRALTDAEVWRLYTEPFAGLDTVYGDMSLDFPVLQPAAPIIRRPQFTAI